MPDAREEVSTMIREGFARKEAAWRRENPGKVRFYLEGAPDDPATSSEEMQISLRGVVSALRENHIEADTPFMVMDAVGASGGYTGEISILFTAVGPVLSGIFGAWMQARKDRKLRIKDGDMEVEAQTMEQIDGLLLRVKALRENAKEQSDDA